LARHAKAVDQRDRPIRLSAVAAVWLAGLVAGFYGLLGAAARYGCGVNDHGLACRGSGSVLGILIVVAVIGVVTAVTLLAADRPRRSTVTIAGVGLAALVFCFIAARSLLATA
jgi:hypothetical protein